MSDDLAEMRLHANDTRYRPGQQHGHYESFFLRANHPTRPLAFWIRYTIFSPRHHPEQAQGELWAIVFNGETGRHLAAKRELPFAVCAFDPTRLSVSVGDAWLRPGELSGSAERDGHVIAWDLTYQGGAAPLFLLPLPAYAAPQPKAKSLVASPLARFSGRLLVDGDPLEVENWAGSQNHNWGERHTDHYAWGQVAGFDDVPASFLEIVTARRRLGPLWSPFVTLLVLRHNGEEFALNSSVQMRRARGMFAPFTWRFHSATSSVQITGRITAPATAFVGLTYRNPPGGNKYCLNSKLAACELSMARREGGAWGKTERLATGHRAAFEMLGDQRDPRVAFQI